MLKDSSLLKTLLKRVRPRVAAITPNTIKIIDRLKALKTLWVEVRIKYTTPKTKISKKRSKIISLFFRKKFPAKINVAKKKKKLLNIFSHIYAGFQN